MKGIFLLMMLITGAQFESHAQGGPNPSPVPNFPGFTVRWTGGYAWQVGGNENIPVLQINSYNPTVDQWGTLNNIPAAGSTPQTIKNTYGHGFNIGLRFGYMFNPYIGVDVGVSYAQSITISAYQQTIFYQADSLGNVNNPQNTGGYLNNTVTTKSLSIAVSPSITLAYSKPKFKFYPYLRAGVTLPVFTQVTHAYNMTLDGYNANVVTLASPYFIGDVTSITSQTNMLFTVGVTGALGVVWRPFNFINFFAEVNGQYLNMTGKYTLITSWNSDGVDETQYRGAYRLEFDYVKSVNAQSNNALYNAGYNINAPKQEISPVFPFSNIGFNVGVQLVLNKKVFKDEDGFDQDRNKVKPEKKKKKKKKTDDEAKPAGTS